MSGEFEEFHIAGRVWDITRIINTKGLRMKEDYIIVLLAEVVRQLRILNRNQLEG